MTLRTVLIADDDRGLVRALEVRCCQLGLNVLVAHDATAALIKARQHRPDLICLDVSMPAGSGLSVCEMLDSDPEFRGTPVIILTGREDEDTIRRCHTMCAYYVLKSTDVWQRVGPLIREILDVQLSDGKPGAERPA